jgi:predicted porin
MNNKIKLAVAGAVLSAASVANAGIIIPAGDWTIDINGNVNAFYNMTNADKPTGTKSIVGGLAKTEDADGEDTIHGINTGLLPSWLGFTGTTRQNDVDVSFTISFQPNASDNGAAGDSKTPLNRQAFVTFGDKSWGSFKLGKDLGIFAGQAILNDMTLLGVGAGAGVSGGSTTLGGIGTGYIYPAWKGQIAYTTPNMNGFQATIAVTNPNQGAFGDAVAVSVAGVTSATELYQDRLGIEGQLMYSWTGDVAGKVWASGASYDVNIDASGGSNATSKGDTDSYTATAFDIGATITTGNLGVTAYYYDGDGAGTTLMGSYGVDLQGTSAAPKAKKRDSDGGYVQVTYVIPTGTKLGVAYGVSNLDKASGETNAELTSSGSDFLVEKNERWTVGAYHPLTKHLNLVAEYNKIDSEAHQPGVDYDSNTFSLGAILFF